MIKYENRCVGCGLPCFGDGCVNKNVPVKYCDKCGDEITGESYNSQYEGDLCERCMKELATQNWNDIYDDLQDEILVYLGFVREKD